MLNNFGHIFFCIFLTSVVFLRPFSISSLPGLQVVVQTILQSVPGNIRFQQEYYSVAVQCFDIFLIKPIILYEARDIFVLS